MAAEALYLHVPFCVRRCLYCDFYIVPLGSGPPATRLREFRQLQHHAFLEALDHELSALPPDFQPRTVYLGGGTPTELPLSDLNRLFESLHRRVDFSRVTEFSCEANPGTLDAAMAELLVSHGVNRVSLGVQSFDDATLEMLGRIHNADQARQAVRDLRTAGLQNLSVDLLFGLPRTVPEITEINLRALADLHPEHVSWYSLEFEQGTAFTQMRDQGFLPEPTEEKTAAEYQRLREGLSALGYQQYELFSFTRPGFACAHNQTYWLGGEFHGCGPSAHRHVGGVRSANVRDLALYIRNWKQDEPCAEEAEELEPEAKARERLMTALRMTSGVKAGAFAAASGFSIPALLGPALSVWEKAGWVSWDGTTLALCPSAYLISDSLFREFV
jgi:oxygen-independent coproporphyrinogen III oxidase